MPAKPDFQVLVDFCEQPAPNPYQRRVVAAALSLSKEDQRDTHYTGFLDYYPPHLSKWWPEHFQGILTGPFSPSTVSIALAVADRFAIYDLTWSGGPPNGRYGWEEHDVEDVSPLGDYGVDVRMMNIGPDGYTGFLHLVGTFIWA